MNAYNVLMCMRFFVCTIENLAIYVHLSEIIVTQGLWSSLTATEGSMNSPDKTIQNGPSGCHAKTQWQILKTMCMAHLNTQDIRVLEFILRSTPVDCHFGNCPSNWRCQHFVFRRPDVKVWPAHGNFQILCR